MGTEVLRPQDCLIDRIRVSPAVYNHQRRKNFNAGGNGNGNPNPRAGSRKSAVRTEQKKRVENGNRSEPVISRRSASLDDLRKNQSNNKNLMVGQITILKRGESLDKANGGDQRPHRPAKSAGEDLFGMGRLGPDPGMVSKEIRIGDLKSVSVSPAGFSGRRSDVYAGSTVSLSPSPRSLPLPSFFSKKQVSRISDDSATRDLRRLLRLE